MPRERPAASGPTAPLPRPVPVPSGEAAFGLRRGRWLFHVFLALSLLAGLVILSHQALQRSGPWVVVAFALPGVGVTAWLSGLLAEAMAAQRAGAMLRLDAQGVHHCQLPLLSWNEVHGVDLREWTSRGGEQWSLVLALAAAPAATLKFPAWRFFLDASLPRVDAAGRLSIPLLYVDAEPEQLAGMAISLADRWGAPRMADWRHGADPALSFAPRSAPTQHDAAQQADDLLRRLRQAGGTP